MILVRRLLNMWPRGAVSIDRPRWVTALVAPFVLLVWIAVPISLTSGEGWLGVLGAATFGVAAWLCYRLELGLYSLRTPAGLKIRPARPGRTLNVGWEEIRAIGVARTHTGGFGQAVVACLLVDGRRVALPSTRYRLGATDFQARLLRQIDPDNAIARTHDLGIFGPLQTIQNDSAAT